MSKPINKREIIDRKEILVTIHKFWLILPLLLAEIDKELSILIPSEICGHIKAVYLANSILQHTLVGHCENNHQIVAVDSNLSVDYDMELAENQEHRHCMRWHSSYHIRCGCPSIQLGIGTIYTCDEISGGQVSFVTFTDSLYHKYTGRKRTFAITHNCT